MIRHYPVFLILFIFIYSCSNSHNHWYEERFFAVYSEGEERGLYFTLYNDNSYKICNDDGKVAECDTGKFKLNHDTLTLFNLSRRFPLKSNKLLIILYNEQDSTFWKWKYSKFLGVGTWQDFKWLDSVRGKGDVYQLNDSNQLIQNDFHFIIDTER